jgi:hypothetical protein
MQSRVSLAKSLLVVGALLAGSCGSGASSASITAGQYDGTFTQNSSLASASFIVGPTLTTLTLVETLEGTQVAACTITQARYQIVVNLDNASGNGTVNEVLKFQGNGCTPGGTQLLRNLNIARTAGGGTNFASLDGSWTLTTNGTEIAHVTVTGNTFTGDYTVDSKSTPLHFNGNITDAVLTMQTDTGVELAAARH